MDRFNKVFDDQAARQNHLESTDPEAVGRKQWEKIQAEKAELENSGAQQAEPAKAEPAKAVEKQAPKAMKDPKPGKKDPPK